MEQLSESNGLMEHFIVSSVEQNSIVAIIYKAIGKSVGQKKQAKVTVTPMNILTNFYSTIEL